jgi:hypothetical protein
VSSEQIRGVLPHTVTPLSLRYPQLLCILARFSSGAMCPAPQNSSGVANDRAVRAIPSGLTMRQRAGGFCVDPEQVSRRGARSGDLHQFKTTAPIAPPW